MDRAATWRVRVRHALRVAVGSAAIAALGLSTPATTGCTPSVLFFISLIAGTPENHQGFQLRSASLTFVGALLAALLYLLIALMATNSTIATFFAAVPPVLFLSALRTDKALMPMPAVSNVYTGFLLISRFGDPRSVLLKNVAAFLTDAAIAWGVALAVNVLLPPDRAADLGRHIAAVQLRRLGAVISSVATRTFSRASCTVRPLSSPYSHSPADSAPSHLSIFLEHRARPAAAPNTGLLPEDYDFLTAAFPRRRLQPRRQLTHREERIKVAEASLAFIHDLRPFGRSRVSDYASLARASQLFAASAYEPRILPEASSRWRNVAAWDGVVKSMRKLVSKVSSLESVACINTNMPRFSDETLVQFFGEAYLPLWVAHFASCSAACAKMSTALCSATCKEMFHLSDFDSSGSCDVARRLERRELDWTIDPRRWGSRRSTMYFGFLLRYRLGLRQFCRQQYKKTGNKNGQDMIPDVSRGKGAKHPFVRVRSTAAEHYEPLGLKYSESATDLTSLNRKMPTVAGGVKPANRKYEAVATPLSERQALSYFASTSNALGEEIAHVQQAMSELASSSDARGALAPFYFLCVGFIAFWKSAKKIVKRNLSAWELRFAFTHSMLLLSILALALFLPLRERFEASELAWVYTSAALAAQLSAEPTVFIGTIRVVATIAGASVAFGFTSILDALGRKSGAVQYIAIPYMFILTVLTLMLVPTAFRYASFLLLATNAVMTFCPRSSPNCSKVLEQHNPECFPDWQYAISRSVNVSVGVVFAVFFHLMFWPRFANQVALQNLAKAFINASRLFSKLHQAYFAYGTACEKTSRPLNEGLKEKSSHSANSIYSIQERESYEVYNSTLGGDVFSTLHPMLSEIEDKVGEPIAEAMLIVKSEADVWRRGPFRLYPLIPHLLSDFVALNVSLGEMAAVLGRRPIFSDKYGRLVFEHYILPMIDAYETIQISLHNLVGVADRTVVDTEAESLRENVADLHQAIIHLARTRGQLRQDAEKRALEFKEFSAMALSRQRPAQFSSPDMPADESLAWLIEDAMQVNGLERRRKRKLTRSISADRDTGFGKSPAKLCVDDVVLYDAFTVITDGCLSAFVRIAATVLVEAESQLEEMEAKKRR